MNVDAEINFDIDTDQIWQEISDEAEDNARCVATDEINEALDSLVRGIKNEGTCESCDEFVDALYERIRKKLFVNQVIS